MVDCQPFTGRVTQSLFDPEEVLLQIYTDDPIASILATPQRARRIVSMLCLIWLVLGFSLSFHKAQYGHQVVWVGYQLTSHGDCVTAAIKQSFMDNLRQTTEDILKRNVVGHRKLKSYTGCANHVANLLFAWRPFLDTLWAASAGTSAQPEPHTKKKSQAFKRKKSRSPRGTVWVKQVRTSLLWILSFLSLHQGPLSRTWDLHYFLQYLPYTDAGPRRQPVGLGWCALRG